MHVQRNQVSAIIATSSGVTEQTEDDLSQLRPFILQLKAVNYFLKKRRYKDAAKALPRSAPELLEGFENLRTWHEFLKAELLVLGSDHSNRFLIPSIPSSSIPSSSILLPSQVLKTCAAAAAAAAVRSPPLTLPQVIGTACTPTELSRFETDPTSFESFHPELSEMERYSLLLNLAIIKQRVPLVEQLLVKLGSTNYGLTALTCVDIGMLSPVTQLLLFENPQILRLIEQFIDTQGENNRVKFRASDRELANMMSSFRFLKKKDEPLRYFKVLESLYENLDRVSEFLKEIRVIC